MIYGEGVQYRGEKFDERLAAHLGITLMELDNYRARGFDPERCNWCDEHHVAYANFNKANWPICAACIELADGPRNRRLAQEASEP